MATSFLRTFLSRTYASNRDVARAGRVSLPSPGHGKQRAARVYSTAAGPQMATGGRMVKLSYALGTFVCRILYIRSILSDSNAMWLFFFCINGTATTTLVCSSTYLLGLFAPPSMYQLINPRSAPAPLASESEEGKKHIEKIENELFNLKLLEECRKRDGSSQNVLLCCPEMWLMLESRCRCR